MRSVHTAAVFLIAVIVFALIYKLPAKFIYQQLPSNASIQLKGISGSIWSGHVDEISTPQLSINNLDWDLSVWALLVGDVDMRWMLNDSAMELQGDVSLSNDYLKLSDMQGSIDLVELGERLPEQEILLGGKIELDITTIEIESNEVIDAIGTINWEPAQLLLPRNIELGKFKAELSSDLGALVADLSDTGGATSLAGDFNLLVNGKYSYTVTLSVIDTSVPGLLEGFNQLAPHDHNGRANLNGHGMLF